MKTWILRFGPALGWALLLLFLSLKPKSGLTAPVIPHLDKLGHFFFYAVLTLLLLYGLHKQYGNVYFRWNIKLALIAVSLYGVIIEFFQHYLTAYRHFDLLDIFANITGCTAAILGVLIYKNFRYENI